MSDAKKDIVVPSFVGRDALVEAATVLDSVIQVLDSRPANEPTTIVFSARGRFRIRRGLLADAGKCRRGTRPTPHHYANQRRHNDCRTVGEQGVEHWPNQGARSKEETGEIKMILRIATIWLAVSILFVVFLWPDIADHLNGRVTRIQRWFRLRRQRKAWARVELIIQEEREKELKRMTQLLDDEIQSRRILAKLDYEYRASADGRRSA